MSNYNCRIITDFKRPDKELVEQLKDLPVATLDDCMNRMAAMDSGLHPYTKKKTVVGPAFTIKVPYGDNLMMHKSVEMIKEGDVLVIQCENSMNRAIFGDLLVNDFIVKKAAGIVVDGSIRDSKDIGEIEKIAVYAKGTSPNGPFKNGPGEINTPVTVGGQIVRPGDIICGDMDGLVVIPVEFAAQVAEETRQKMKEEEHVLEMIYAGTFKRPWMEKTLENLHIDVINDK